MPLSLNALALESLPPSKNRSEAISKSKAEVSASPKIYITLFLTLVCPLLSYGPIMYQSPLLINKSSLKRVMKWEACFSALINEGISSVWRRVFRVFQDLFISFKYFKFISTIPC